MITQPQSVIDYQARPAAPGYSRLPKVPQGAWLAGTVSLAMLILGLISMAAGQPLLFPSLAPATVNHAAYPRLNSARPYNTVVGQLLAIGAAYLAVWLVGAAAAPPVFAGAGFPARRMWAAVLGMGLTVTFQNLAGAVNSPAAATTLLIALGAFAPLARDFWTLIGGVLIMAAVGEPIRRLRLAQLAPHEGHAG